MRVRSLRRFIPFLLAGACFCQNLSRDSDRLLAFKTQSAALLADIPSYTCLESMAQSVEDPTGRVHDIELLRVDIAVSSTNEMYAWANSRKFSDRSLAELLSNGFNTTGIFSNLGGGLATMDLSHIEFTSSETLGEEAVYRYAFRVPAEAGAWQINSHSQNGVDDGKAGEEGSFWIDSRDLTLRRIDVRAADIPRSLRLKALRAIVDYEQMTIGDRRVLLPAEATVRTKLKSTDFEAISHITFNHCRAFTAESSFSFDGAARSHTDEMSKVGLPDGLTIPVKLSAPINSSSADQSDRLKAIVSQSVRFKGKEIIRQGAGIEGHVFRRRMDAGFGIEIDRVDTINGWQPFYGRLLSIDGGASYLQQDKQRASLLPAPGVAVIKLTPGGEIPAGTRMVWTTEPLATRVILGDPDAKNCQMCFGMDSFH